MSWHNYSVIFRPCWCIKKWRSWCIWSLCSRQIVKEIVELVMKRRALWKISAKEVMDLRFTGHKSTEFPWKECGFAFVDWMENCKIQHDNLLETIEADGTKQYLHRSMPLSFCVQHTSFWELWKSQVDVYAQPVNWGYRPRRYIRKIVIFSGFICVMLTQAALSDAFFVSV